MDDLSSDSEDEYFDSVPLGIYARQKQLAVVPAPSVTAALTTKSPAAQKSPTHSQSVPAVNKLAPTAKIGGVDAKVPHNPTTMAPPSAVQIKTTKLNSTPSVPERPVTPSPSLKKYPAPKPPGSISRQASSASIARMPADASTILGPESLVRQPSSASIARHSLVITDANNTSTPNTPSPGKRCQRNPSFKKYPAPAPPGITRENSMASIPSMAAFSDKVGTDEGNSQTMNGNTTTNVNISTKTAATNVTANSNDTVITNGPTITNGKTIETKSVSLIKDTDNVKSNLIVTDRKKSQNPVDTNNQGNDGQSNGHIEDVLSAFKRGASDSLSSIKNGTNNRVENATLKPNTSNGASRDASVENREQHVKDVSRRSSSREPSSKSSGKLSNIASKFEAESLSVSESSKSIQKSPSDMKTRKFGNKTRNKLGSLASKFESNESKPELKILKSPSASIGKLQSPYSKPFDIDPALPPVVHRKSIGGINVSKFGGTGKFPTTSQLRKNSKADITESDKPSREKSETDLVSNSESISIIPNVSKCNGSLPGSNASKPETEIPDSIVDSPNIIMDAKTDVVDIVPKSSTTETKSIATLSTNCNVVDFVGSTCTSTPMKTTTLNAKELCKTNTPTSNISIETHSVAIVSKLTVSENSNSKAKIIPSCETSVINISNADSPIVSIKTSASSVATSIDTSSSVTAISSAITLPSTVTVASETLSLPVLATKTVVSSSSITTATTTDVNTSTRTLLLDSSTVSFSNKSAPVGTSTATPTIIPVSKASNDAVSYALRPIVASDITTISSTGSVSSTSIIHSSIVSNSVPSIISKASKDEAVSFALRPIVTSDNVTIASSGSICSTSSIQSSIASSSVKSLLESSTNISPIVIRSPILDNTSMLDYISKDTKQSDSGEYGEFSRKRYLHSSDASEMSTSLPSNSSAIFTRASSLTPSGTTPPLSGLNISYMDDPYRARSLTPFDGITERRSVRPKSRFLSSDSRASVTTSSAMDLDKPETALEKYRRRKEMRNAATKIKLDALDKQISQVEFPTSSALKNNSSVETAVSEASSHKSMKLKFDLSGIKDFLKKTEEEISKLPRYIREPWSMSSMLSSSQDKATDPTSPLLANVKGFDRVSSPSPGGGDSSRKSSSQSMESYTGLKTSPSSGDDEVYVDATDAIDTSQMDTLMPLPDSMSLDRRCRSVTPNRILANTEKVLSQTDRLLKKSRSGNSLRKSYSRSMSAANIDRVSISPHLYILVKYYII